MDPVNLVHMANRIGEFFAPLADRREALDGIATHVRRYWAPRMRRQIFEQIDGGTASELSELVREALVLHRGTLAPQG